jgi:hypothetical protein
MSVDHMVNHRCPIFRARLCRPDVHPAIQAECIGIDDLRAESTR